MTTHPIDLAASVASVAPRSGETAGTGRLAEIAAIAVPLLAALVVAAPATAFDEDSLTIWIGDNKAKADLEKALAPFTEDLGIGVNVEIVEPKLPDRFQQAAATGDGPDLIFYAHDRFGEWAAGGLIQPVEPSAAFADGVLDTAMEALAFDGRVWGYPIAVEAIALIYNKAYVEEPPATFEEIAELELPEGVQPILWDYNNTYFTFPLMMANGGYAFQKVDGAYDGKDTGVDNAGAIAGAAVLREMIDSGVMPKGVDYGVMDGAMKKGEVAMVVNGPWAWSDLAAAGVDFGVAPLPSVGGEPARPFVGVYSAAINAASPNADLAVELLEGYLLTDEALATWNASNELGALADLSAAEAQTDPKVAATLANAEAGVPMPSNPEMGAFWSAMEPALGNITTGAQSVEDALKDAGARIRGE